MALKIQDIEDFYKSNGCVLLSKEYLNRKTLLQFICKCGEIDRKTLPNFKNTPKCKKCSRKLQNLANKKYDIEYVRNKMAEYDCKLISTEYIRNKKLEYICKCGNLKTGTFYGFLHLKKKGCKKCSKDNLPISAYGEKFERNINKIKDFFTQNQCTLLSEKYLGYDIPLDFICKCGNKDKKRFCQFFKHPYCKKCGFKTVLRKENHHSWNPNREEVKENIKFCFRVRSALNRCLRACGKKKLDRTENILGYKFKDLLLHLKSHINWEKVKDSEWSIDHIFPIKAFLDYGIKDIQLINCLENLQPITKIENSKKGDKYNKEDFEKWLKRKGIVLGKVD